MNDDLLLALKDALNATAEIDPRNLDAEDLALWHACDRRCTEIIEVLIREHDECAPAARQLLKRIAAM